MGKAQDAPEILIVDDDESTCKSLSLILKKKDYSVTTARTGAEALETAKRKSFNVALLDIKLPDMDGVDLIDPLKAANPDVTVIMITGYASLDNAVEALNKGASAYILKPINMPKFLVTLEQLLETQRLVVENRELLAEVHKELTERKRVEQELRESEKRFRILIETSPDGILVDQAGSLIFANPAYQQMFGIKDLNHCQGKLYAPFIAPSDRERVLAISAAREAGEPAPTTYEFTGIRTDGTEFLLEVAAAPFEHGGKPANMAVLRDITERKQAEEELEASERRYSSVVNNLDEILFQTDTDGRWLFLNPAWTKITGYSVEESLGQRFLDFVYPEDRERNVELFKPLVEGKKDFCRHEIRYRTKDNRIIWIDVFGCLSFDDNNEISGTIGTLTDITERKQAEEELAASEAMLLESQRVARLGSYSLDIQSGMWTSSDILDEIFGIDDEYVRSIDGWLAIVHPDWQTIMASYFADEIIEKRSRFDKEYKILRPGDGFERWVHGLGELSFDDKGNPVGMIGTIQDITDTKRANSIQNIIYKISESTHTSENLDELYRSIHLTLGELLRVENFFIALYDEAADSLSFPYFVDQFDKRPDNRQLTGKGLTEYVLRLREPLLAPPEVFAALIRAGKVNPIGTRMVDWLGVPLMISDRILGVMVVQSYTEGVHYGEEEKDILQFVSTQIARVIERKRTEEELKESRQFAANLIDSSLDMIIAVDRRRRITEFNRSAQLAFGYARDEAIGKHVNMLYADPGKGLAIHKKTVLNGQHIQEILNLRKNGETFPSMLSASVLRDSAGAVVGVMGVSRDISQQKQAEEQLQRYKHIVSASTDMLALLDNNFQYLAVNSAYSEAFNKTSAEIVGRDAPAIIGEAFFKEFIKPNAERCMAGDRVNFQEWFEFPAQGRKYMDINYIPYQSHGEIVGFAVNGRDITESRNTEEALLISESRFRSVIENAAVAIILANHAGDIIAWNRKAKSLFGYTDDVIIGKSLAKLIPVRFRKAHKSALKRVSKGGGRNVIGKTVDLFGLRKNGSEFPLELSLSAWGTGAEINYAAMIRDVTKRKILEQKLHMDDKLRAVGELSAGIAHEINSPMQFIGSNLRFLNKSSSSWMQKLRVVEKLISEEREVDTVELLDQIKAAFSTGNLAFEIENVPRAIHQSLEGVQRITEIILAMRAFSHPGDEKKAPVDINEAIRNTTIVARNEYKYDAELVLDLDPHLPSVPCFAGEIKQVLLNLLVNAAQAVSEASARSTHSKMGVITIATQVKEGSAVISITDTGVGIPADVQPRIFEPFFTTKEVGKGTGQGLAIAHAVVVEKHGGSITLKTKMGKGTTFTVTLPLE